MHLQPLGVYSIYTPNHSSPLNSIQWLYAYHYGKCSVVEPKMAMIVKTKAERSFRCTTLLWHIGIDIDVMMLTILSSLTGWT